ncbi:MAG: hypothetical protein M3Y65_11755 [Pseudomonadota bacterium]|nr:hypothetical protein [Pseudomonadota bacterium]
MGLILGGSPLVRYLAGKVNIVFHGNSLIYGQSGATVPTGAMPYQVQRLPPVNDQITCINKGVNGQSWAGMRNTGNQVDALFDSTKINVLVVMEGHNSTMGEGKSPAQAIADATAYMADRLATHPEWLILVADTQPAYYQSWDDNTAASKNSILLAYNTLLKNQYRAMGAKVLIETRLAGSPFAFASYTKATFQAAKIGGQSIFSPNDREGGAPDGQFVGQLQWVHYSDIGNGALAQIFASGLRRLPRK